MPKSNLIPPSSLTPCALRTRLLRFARRLPSADREDVVQEALLAAIVNNAADPLLYACGVTRNLAKRAHRVSAHSQLHDVPPLLPETDLLLAAAQDFVRLDAALEQILVWHDGGRTTLTVSSVASFPVLSTRTQLHAALEVFGMLPCTPRHQRRQREKFEKDLAAAFQRCACVVDPSLPPAHWETEQTSNSNRKEAEPGGSDDTISALYIMDQALMSAVLTAGRYGRLPLIAALKIAFAAVAQAAPKLTMGCESGQGPNRDSPPATSRTRRGLGGSCAPAVYPVEPVVRSVFGERPRHARPPARRATSLALPERHLESEDARTRGTLKQEGRKTSRSTGMLEGLAPHLGENSERRRGRAMRSAGHVTASRGAATLALGLRALGQATCA